MVLDGFVDVSQMLKCGVYALGYQGKIIYVGQSKCMLVRVYSHRNARSKKGRLPSWYPVKGIVYDEIHIMPVHPDRVDAVEREMINRYKPKYNTQIKNRLPVDVPINLSVGGIALTLNSGVHPTTPNIERRI
jgi:hypothetical protein